VDIVSGAEVLISEVLLGRRTLKLEALGDFA
jgi:hypothetical protein